MNESVERDRYRIVVLFALAGAAFGALVSMLCFAHGGGGYGRTDIDRSLALSCVTTVCGACLGVQLSYSARTGSALAAGVLLLTILVGAAMGWLVGDAQTRDSVLRAGAPSPARATTLGGSVGALVGVLVLAVRWLGARRTGAARRENGTTELPIPTSGAAPGGRGR